MKFGAFAGPVVNFQLNEILRLETGIRFNMKGTRDKASAMAFGTPIEAVVNTTIYYFELPLVLKAGVKRGNVTVFGMAGGYAGLAFAGKVNVKITVAGKTDRESWDLPIGNDPELHAIKPLDFGYIVGFGVGSGPLEFIINFSNSISNISTYTGEGTSAHNMQFLTGVSYFF